MTCAHANADKSALAPWVFWEAVRSLLAWMTPLFGQARDFAGTWITRARRSAVLGWLAPLERLARLALLIAAAELAPKGLAARKRRTNKAKRLARVLDPDAPALWPVRFPVLSAAGAGGAASGLGRGVAGIAGARRAGFDGCVSGWPLALRWHGLARIAADPDGYALRLARAMSRAMARAPVQALARARRLIAARRFDLSPCGETLRAAEERAAAVLTRLDSS